mgnify:CR=1 FL=1
MTQADEQDVEVKDEGAPPSEPSSDGAEGSTEGNGVGEGSDDGQAEDDKASKGEGGESLEGLVPTNAESNLSDDEVGEILAWASESGFDRETTQALLDREASLAGDAFAKVQERRDEWVEDLKADKVFGGDKYEANQKAIDVFLAKYAPKDFAGYLDTSGARDFPPFVQFMHAMVGLGKEAGPPAHDGSPAEPKPKRSDRFARSRASMERSAAKASAS